MGIELVVESTDFLLQREDQPAALAALKSYLDQVPGDFRLDGPLEVATLVEAFEIGYWRAEVDEHGDIVGLLYDLGYPPDANDDYPMSILGALAPFVRHGHFLRWTEGDRSLDSHHVGRGRNIYHRRSPGVWLRQVGQPPAVR